jgi:hypothetical protein
MARSRELPVNFAQTKQPRPPKSPNQRLYVLAACLAGVLLLGGMVWARFEKERMETELETMDDELTRLDEEVKVARAERTRMQALHDWEGVCWPDELYELSRLMPTVTQTFRVRKLEGSPDRAPARPTVAVNQKQQTGPPSLAELSARPIARLSLELNSPDDQPLNRLASSLHGAGKDALGGFYRPEPHGRKNEGGSGVGMGGGFRPAPIIYQTVVKVRKRAPGDYTETMAPKAP